MAQIGSGAQRMIGGVIARIAAGLAAVGHGAAVHRPPRPLVDAARNRLPALSEIYHLRETPELDPRVYYRLTDNWLELSLRFVARDHDVRALKDAMSRDILAALEAARIGIASGTYAVVEMPPLTVRTVPA